MKSEFGLPDSAFSWLYGFGQVIYLSQISFSYVENGSN